MKAAKRKTPLILVSGDIETSAGEFADYSTSLSIRYQRALMRAGGIPWILPATNSRARLAEIVQRCDGVLLTGGNDVAPELYDPAMPKALKGKVVVTPDGGERDYRELVVISEVLRQNKPLLAICRGNQVLNVAFGGTLIPDIPSCCKSPINHRQMEKRCEIVHQVRLTPGSLLAKIVGRLNSGVNSTHHQAVGQAGKGLRVSAVSEDGVIEALELESGHARRLPFLLSVQFHPERLEDRYSDHRAIFRAFVRAC